MILVIWTVILVICTMILVIWTDTRNLDRDTRNLDRDTRNLDRDTRNLDRDTRNLDARSRSRGRTEDRCPSPSCRQGSRLPAPVVTVCKGWIMAILLLLSLPKPSSTANQSRQCLRRTTRESASGSQAEATTTSEGKCSCTPFSSARRSTCHHVGAHPLNGNG